MVGRDVRPARRRAAGHDRRRTCCSTHARPTAGAWRRRPARRCSRSCSSDLRIHDHPHGPEQRRGGAGRCRESRRGTSTRGRGRAASDDVLDVADAPRRGAAWPLGEGTLRRGPRALTAAPPPGTSCCRRRLTLAVAAGEALLWLGRPETRVDRLTDLLSRPSTTRRRWRGPGFSEPWPRRRPIGSGSSPARAPTEQRRPAAAADRPLGPESGPGRPDAAARAQREASSRARTTTTRSSSGCVPPPSGTGSPARTTRRTAAGGQRRRRSARGGRPSRDGSSSAPLPTRASTSPYTGRSAPPSPVDADRPARGPGPRAEAGDATRRGRSPDPDGLPPRPPRC